MKIAMEMQDFVGSRMENGKNQETDLVFFCNVDSGQLDHVKSEGMLASRMSNVYLSILIFYS